MINGTRHPNSFRWLMLALSFLGGLSLGLLYLSTVPLVLAVERDLNLTAAQVALWVNVPITCGIFLCIPIGLAVDTWSPKLAGGLGLTLLGVGAVSRGLANSYAFLFVASVFFGIGFMISFVSLQKSLAIWFPYNEIGMATGVFLTGNGLGSALGLSVVQPIFGNAWRDCFWTLGWLGITAAISWWLLARDRPQLQDPTGEHAEPCRVGSPFKDALRTRVIWLLVLGFFCYIAGFTSWFTFGFPFLVRFRDLSASAAGLVLTLTMGGYTLAAISMPALSDRLGRRKPFFLFYSMLGSALFVTLSVWKANAFVWIAALLIGACFGSLNPLVFTVAAEARELGPALVGAALGTIISLGSIAGLLVPVLVGRFLGALNMATEQAFHAVWLLTALWPAGLFLCGLLLKETGPISRGSTR
jgi:MFS family permease